MTKNNKNLKKDLTPEQFYVTQEKGTEVPFTGELLNEKREGKFNCVCCDTELFSSKHKFDSGTGWPSFFLPLSEKYIKTKV